MEGTDTLAAIETAEHFFDSYNYALGSGDTAPMLDISSSDCDPCKSLVEKVRAVYESKHWMSGGTVNYSDAAVPEDYADREEQSVQFQVLQTDAFVRNAAGDVLDEVAGGDQTLQVLLRFENGSWLVTDLQSSGPAQ